MSLPLPFDLGLMLSPWALLAAIALATLVSEDLTCISVGLLVANGRADPLVGVAGCFLGIFVGDLGLWLLGRWAGRRVLRWSWLHRRLPARRLEQLGQVLDENCGKAVVSARFLPGTRVPLYVTAGVLGRRGKRFIFWTFVACLVWTPLLVLSVALFGDTLAGPLQYLVGPGWLVVLLSVSLGYATFRILLLACSRIGRAKLAATVVRLWRWEFWPTWLFYAPVLPWLAWSSLRYRSVTVWTAANPGIPAGGVVGESKHAILTQLSPEWVIPSILLPPGDIAERLRQFRQSFALRGWTYPLIFKPDAGQRGAGVKKVRDTVEVEKYVQREPAAILVQPYHPGPYEAGIFYYRFPGEAAGHIFSITDKQFPVMVGDGHLTLEELIWRHPRYRMQAHTFLRRHAAEADRVLGDGERFPLAVAGNHCQGTMFRDGSHLLTPELQRVVDAIVRPFAGFFIGRFDVRYSEVEAFRAGRDLAVVELNGATSESTNIYDPSWSLWAAYRTLFRQWALLYQIGHANRQRGHEPTPVLTLVRCVFDYYRGRRIDPLSD
jgi:membrane protein DedA with SNARE-associated domain